MSELTFIIGGARSGKSAFAMKLAKEQKHVCYIATADSGHASQIDDGEMLERIQKHRNNRPADWETVEAPLDLDKAVSNLNGTFDIVLIDCITLYVTNMLLGGSEEAGDEYIIDAINKLCIVCKKIPSHVIIVSNEVGYGSYRIM
jgi:adenosylcobinamide kinase/adenosylcobinamide-phosphate guanylyltransferase